MGKKIPGTKLEVGKCYYVPIVTPEEEVPDLITYYDPEVRILGVWKHSNNYVAYEDAHRVDPDWEKYARILPKRCFEKATPIDDPLKK